jgi:hypothetical protein
MGEIQEENVRFLAKVLAEVQVNFNLNWNIL